MDLSILCKSFFDVILNKSFLYEAFLVIVTITLCDYIISLRNFEIANWVISILIFSGVGRILQNTHDN
jgi:hypothetical protein